MICTTISKPILVKENTEAEDWISGTLEEQGKSLEDVVERFIR